MRDAPDAPDAPPDEALVRAAQAGDAAAFGRLYDRHFAAVYGYLASQVPTPAEAEDLAGDVFLRALAALPGYRWTGVPVRTWLLRIARNRLVDARRQRARRPTAPLDAAGALPDGARTADPARWLADKVDRERLLAAVARLTALQRRVVTLKFAAGLSNGEVAAALGRSEGAVKALQHAALDALRRHLADLAPGGTGAAGAPGAARTIPSSRSSADGAGIPPPAPSVRPGRLS